MLKYLLILLFSAYNMVNAATIYVSNNGSDSNNGMSWASAYATLQQALDASKGGDHIWVAEGTYIPTSFHTLTVGIRGNHFQMKNGVQIYGGFPATGNPTMDDRDWEQYETILSGDLNGDDVWNNALNKWDNIEDNTFHVIMNPTANKINSTAILDGFTISGGHAQGSSLHRQGGGIYNLTAHPIIRNCKFIGNSAIEGGAAFNAASQPVFMNCKFLDNVASSNGGAMYFSNSKPKIIGSIFNNNRGYYGGAIHLAHQSDALVNNSLFTDNVALGNGAAFYNFYAKFELNNCTVTENTASWYGGGIYSWASASESSRINNSIFWGNLAGYIGNEVYAIFSFMRFNYSCVSRQNRDISGILLNGNGEPVAFSNCIYENPRFSGRGSIYRYSLSGISPLLDMGLDSFINEEYDIRGNGFPRKVSSVDGNPGNIDIGAYEYQVGIDPEEPLFYKLHVNKNATGNNDGLSWANAMTHLEDALSFAEYGDQIWVAEGTYHPTKNVGGESVRYKTFQMKNGVEIYGGFPANGEPTMDDRDWNLYPTILSGDHNNDDYYDEATNMWLNREDNSYHIFYHDRSIYLSRSAILDGFTVFGGQADGTNPNIMGGAMFNIISSPSLRNCTFKANTAVVNGGAIFNRYSQPSINNCEFIENLAYFSGGAMYNWYDSSPQVNDTKFIRNRAGSNGGAILNGTRSQPIFNRCVFQENIAEDGGALMIFTSRTRVFNSLFVDNLAYVSGGAVFAYESSKTIDDEIIFPSEITNSTLVNNKAFYHAGAVYIDTFNFNLNNTILWNNSADIAANEIFIRAGHAIINHSCLMDGHDNIRGKHTINNSILNQNPLFVLDGEHPYLIRGSSPCVDAGNNDFIDEELDIRGYTFIRKLNSEDASAGIVDIGAYEYQFGRDPVTDVEEFWGDDEIVNIFPNPSSGPLNATISNMKYNSGTIFIYASNGDLIHQEPFELLSNGENLLSLETDGFASGEYLFVFRFPDGNIKTTKSVIIK